MAKWDSLDCLTFGIGDRGEQGEGKKGEEATLVLHSDSPRLSPDATASPNGGQAGIAHRRDPAIPNQA